MTGSWIFICGPSGAGKDSVITWSQQTLGEQANIVFARRMVTRPAQRDSEHDAIDTPGFLSMQRAGQLRWHWQAHDFHYGISQDYEADVNAGRIVVVNGSRDHVNGLPMSPDVKRVEVTASAEKLATRLALRGRDSQDDVVLRLARNTELGLFTPLSTDLTITNDTALADAGARLVAYLIAQAAHSGPLLSTST